MNRLRRYLAVAAIACAAIAPACLAQSEVNGPTALIFTYKAKPDMRVKLRSVMATDGVAQLEKWKKEGVLSSYNALFTAYAGNDTPDMFLVVKFAHFTDLARWQKLEQTNPGGLPEKALSLASVESSATTDIVKFDSAAATTKDSQFLIVEYDVLSDMPKYVSYVKGYVIPQFDHWMKAGTLSGYSSFVNQNPAGAPWGSFIVLEYKNLETLSSREIVKAKARAELAVSDPVWKKWSDDKSAIRKEKIGIPVLSLN